MYESQTYEELLGRMLERVKAEYPNLDYREGSMIFNANAPSAVEMAILYDELDNARNETFIDTASREYILKHCDQMGMDISVFEASNGVHKGTFNVKIPILSRWNCDIYNYHVTSYLGEENGYHIYKLFSETKGAAPNSITGDLTPIPYDNGISHKIPTDLNYAVLTECLIPGEDEATDEVIKAEYRDHVRDIQTDGNVAQYGLWCRQFAGIGNYKVLPLWNGSNTVKVSILSAENKVATDELIADFQEHLDPGTTGMGDGKAPIGAFVTVSTATPKPITVSASVKLADGYKDMSIIDETIKKYFAEISYKKDVLAYMNLGAEILKTEGVDFISNLLINGGTDDVPLYEIYTDEWGDEKVDVEIIPELSTTNWVEVV